MFWRLKTCLLAAINARLHHPGVRVGSPLAAAWTFPAIIGLATIIAWAAEVSQYLISQGMALAILAWLQTLPEFAVEAVIAWNQDIDLMTANFTGSLRLLVGLGWPMIYAVAAISNRMKGNGPLRRIELADEHCIEVTGLFAPTLYFFVVYFKQTISLADAVILILMYSAYILVLSKLPPQEEPPPDELPFVPRRILALAPRARNALIAGMFAGGAVGLYYTADPFLGSMLGLATTIGVSHFVFVQWVAPFLSEFPEKVSAIYWAKRVTDAPVAVMNMVSSNINQWTMLIAMIPIVYSVSVGAPSHIPLDHMHRMEILLTIAQSLLGFMLLSDMRFRWYEAAAMFGLWLAQFAVSELREEITIICFAWVVFDLVLVMFGKRRIVAFGLLGEFLFDDRKGQSD